MAKHITTGKSQRHFDPHVFLSNHRERQGDVVFSKENFDLRSRRCYGWTVLYPKRAGTAQRGIGSGKEATLAILGEDDFFGEGGLAGQLLRMASATAGTDCVLLHVEKKAMVLAISLEPQLSAMFVKCFGETKHPISGRFGRSTFQFE